MSATRLTRGVPAIRRALTLGKGRPTVRFVVRPTVGQVRHFYRGRDNPFSQMEEFMRDMERKFKRDMENVFRDLPSVIESRMPRAPAVRPMPRFGEVEDMSTPDTYRLAFNFQKANPEDVKVSLKDYTLTVSGAIEEVTATSRSSRQVSVEYEIPEGVNIDALESSMSHDGILTVEAPQVTPEAPDAPRPINIQRD